ncbi:hypothetical protein KIF59_12210 [Enterobacter cloacae subsp. cloacae]|nr:hypothetical protein [Enterobacter cloacae subsp. cloacae]
MSPARSAGSFFNRRRRNNMFVPIRWRIDTSKMFVGKVILSWRMQTISAAYSASWRRARSSTRSNLSAGDRGTIIAWITPERSASMLLRLVS